MATSVTTVVQELITNIGAVVRGKDEQIRLAVCCLLTDGHLLFEHRTLERVYFGAGLTRFELNLDIVDEATRDTWEWRSIYNGVYVYAVVRFPP